MNKANTPTKLFITGATGYIGGSVLAKLLEPSQAGKWDITVLTRSEGTISRFKELGVTPLLGSLDNSDLLTQAAIDADVVINCADNDHVAAIQALIKGLSSGGKRRILIHTSGTGVLGDDSRGNSVSEKIYSDLDMESIHALPITQHHKDVDSYIFGHLEGFESIIVCPPTIYGIGTGPFNKLSVQVPFLLKGFLKAGFAGTVGTGVSIWSNIHIDDLANFYLLLLEKALEGKASIGKDGWYFCENGEHSWKEVTTKLAEELYKHHALKEPTIREFTLEEIENYYGKYAWLGVGCNSRSRADRARQLGWKPSGKTPSFNESLEAEVKAFLEKEGLNK